MFETRLNALRTDLVDALRLEIEIQLSQTAEAYKQDTRVAAAVSRAKQRGCPKQPGCDSRSLSQTIPSVPLAEFG